MRKTLTTAKGHKLKEGTILACENAQGRYLGILEWSEVLGPIFRTYALDDGLDDSWEIGRWDYYSVASEAEFVLWKLEHAQ